MIRDRPIYVCQADFRGWERSVSDLARELAPLPRHRLLDQLHHLPTAEFSRAQLAATSSQGSRARPCSEARPGGRRRLADEPSVPPRQMIRTGPCAARALLAVRARIAAYRRVYPRISAGTSPGLKDNTVQPLPANQQFENRTVLFKRLIAPRRSAVRNRLTPSLYSPAYRPLQIPTSDSNRPVSRDANYAIDRLQLRRDALAANQSRPSLLVAESAAIRGPSRQLAEK